jgi:hypothetical protein
MKEEQDKLEKRLWEEREDIRRSHEEKVKVAKNKYAQCPSVSNLLLFPYRPSCLQDKAYRGRPVETGGTGIVLYVSQNTFSYLY